MFVLVLVMLVLFPERSASGAAEGIELLYSAIPSIAPFAVFSGCVIYSGLSRVVGALFAPVFCRLFHVSPDGAAAFVTGLLGGYPTGVKAAVDTYKKGLIDKAEAEKLLGFCNNSGVLFIVETAGIFAFKSAEVGVKLYVIHIISAVIAGVIFRGKAKSRGRLTVREAWRLYRRERPMNMYVLGKSLQSAGSALLNVAAAIIVFNSVSEAFLPFGGPLSGVVEMTRGVFYAAEHKSPILASFFLSWGGLGVHAQAAAIAGECDLDLKAHFRGKIVSAVTAAVLAALVFGL